MPPLIRLVFLALVPALLLATPAAADPDAPAVIVITDEVIAQDVEAVGANLTTIAGGTNFAINNHV